MRIQPHVFLLPLLLAALAFPASAQDVGRVSPASLPMPLPTAAPMPPDRLRAHNPWNLPMTGAWRFQLTYGRITAGQFQPSAPVSHALTASTSQTENPPQNAFDGDPDTRWCASSGDYPQWLQADLGQTRHVSGATLTWEYPGDRYECRIEGRSDGGKWKTLADATAAPGIGDGPVTVTPADVRYVRITVTGTSGQHWASLREFQIRTTENGQEVAWRPPPRSLSMRMCRRRRGTRSPRPASTIPRGITCRCRPTGRWSATRCRPTTPWTTPSDCIGAGSRSRHPGPAGASTGTSMARWTARRCSSTGRRPATMRAATPPGTLT